jgi:uncharacterized protein (DUF1800 family)
MAEVSLARGWAAGVVTFGVAVGLGGVLMQGCKRPAPPPPQTRTVVRQPVRSLEAVPAPEPVPDDDQPMRSQARRRRVDMPQPVEAPIDRRAVDAQAAALQRQQDARLWQQQTAASQKAQRELNQEVDESVKAQQKQQEEPRIKDAPEFSQPPLPAGMVAQPVQPGQEPPRIQDAPPASAAPVQPPSPAPQE